MGQGGNVPEGTKRLTGPAALSKYLKTLISTPPVTIGHANAGLEKLIKRASE